MVRVGTVNAATVPLLIPVVRDFRAAHPLTQVEVVAAQQTDIHRALADGGFGLGLVNHLDGDDMPADFDSTELLSGRLAEMGKLMVAEGPGATVLPDFSVLGDPLERLGTITYRPLAADTARVLLKLRRRRAEPVSQAARDLHEAFVRRARELSHSGPHGPADRYT
jgi:DNA-binding transcriptional LysR family regulator